jgi:hypothetical protein
VVDPATWAGSVPAVNGIAPRVRVGRSKWFNLLWLLPLGFVGLIVAVAVAKGLRDDPAVQRFIAQYPGTIEPSRPAATAGFPAWLRWQHFLNLFLMVFIIRSGLQILSDHPRLYWTRHSTPGRDWFRIQRPVPSDPLWTVNRIPSAFRARSGFRAFVTPSAWRAGGISAPTPCGCSTA